jgi:hypothetical protein
MFVEIGPRSKAGKSSAEKIGTARGTLRLRSGGLATVEKMVCYQDCHLETQARIHQFLFCLHVYRYSC